MAERISMAEVSRDRVVVDSPLRESDIGDQQPDRLTTCTGSNSVPATGAQPPPDHPSEAPAELTTANVEQTPLEHLSTESKAEEELPERRSSSSTTLRTSSRARTLTTAEHNANLSAVVDSGMNMRKRHWWAFVMGAGLLAVSIDVVCFRLAEAQTSAWHAPTAVAWAGSTAYCFVFPWALAFPEAWTRTEFRRTTIFLAVLHILLCAGGFVALSPNTVRLPEVRAAPFRAAWILWNVFYYVALVVYPAWRTRSEWWGRRSHSAAPLFIMIVAGVSGMCTFILNWDVATSILLVLFFLAFGYFSCRSLFADSNLASEAALNPPIHFDGLYLCFYLILVAQFPVYLGFFASFAACRTHTTDGLLAVLVLEVMAEGVLVFNEGVVLPRALKPAFVPPLLFGLFLTADTFLNLVWIESSLTDPYFWAGHAFELIIIVLRDSGLIFEASLLGTDLMGASVEVFWRDCSTGRATTGNDAAQEPSGSSTSPAGVKPELSIRSLQRSLSAVKLSTRQRYATTRAKQSTMENEQLQDEIARLAALSESLAASGLLWMLVVEDTLEVLGVGVTTITHGLSRDERKDTMYCFLVVVFTHACAFYAQRWLVRWRRRRPRQRFGHGGRPASREHAVDLPRIDVDARTRDFDDQAFWKKYGVLFACTAAMVLANCANIAGIMRSNALPMQKTCDHSGS